MLTAICLGLLASVGAVRAADVDYGKYGEPFSRGFGYVGAFWVIRSTTEIRLFSTELPLGGRLDLDKDLGVRDSFTVPRATLGWRFGNRHILTGGYYNLNRDGVRRLERTIELPGDIEFLVGVEVATSFTTEVGKLQYTYLFHRDEKVSPASNFSTPTCSGNWTQESSVSGGRDLRPKQGCDSITSAARRRRGAILAEPPN